MLRIGELRAPSGHSKVQGSELLQLLVVEESALLNVGPVDGPRSVIEEQAMIPAGSWNWPEG